MTTPFDKVLNQLIYAGEIKEEDKEFYIYGLE